MPDEVLVQRLAMLHHLTGSLSRLRLPHKNNSPPENPHRATFQNDKSLIDTQSDSLCTSEPRGSRPLSQPFRRIYAAGTSSIVFCCSSTIFTSGSCPALRRTSRARSLRIPTASAVEKDKSMLLYDYKIHPAEPPHHPTLSWHSRTRVSQRHTTADFASCPPYKFTWPSRTAIPPASTSCAFSFDPDFTCGHLCADLTAPTEFDSGANFVARVPATNPAVLTAETDPINSRASGAGQLACFGLPLRERPCLGGKCQQARGYSWAFATMLRSS